MSIKNGLRWKAELALNELARMRDAIIELPAEQLHRSCVNCDHWEHDKEFCLLAQTRRSSNCRPPATIIAFGCPEWVNIDDDVPF